MEGRPEQPGGSHAPPPQLVPGSPLFGLGYSAPLAARRYMRLSGGELHEESASVAEEIPVAFIFNGRPHAVMMATPEDLEDFAAGFTLTEQIVERAGEIENIQVVRHAQGIELHLQIGERAAAALAERPRNLVGRTSCGLCGVELISDVLRNVLPVAAGAHFDVEALLRAEASLAAGQKLNQATGAMHAAAWAGVDGTLQILKEDVGRHNALDKVIGALGRSGRNGGEGFIVMTSRASYELVQKCAVAGIPLMAAVSRPTGLAIRLAAWAGITLVGLLRDGSANIYTDAHGVLALSTPGRG